MRKRKWWIVLSLAFLATCMGVWKWSERPSYPFLADMPRVYSGIEEGGLYTEMYASRESSQDLSERVSRETGEPLSFDAGRYMPSPVMPEALCGPIMIASYELLRLRLDSSFSSEPEVYLPRPANLPSGTNSLVVLTRQPSPVDRLRAWLYRLRHESTP